MTDLYMLLSKLHEQHCNPAWRIADVDHYSFSQ
jgi:hypothetical protein